nr:MAG TPA: hypothetical protein [Caudoviricetes sp.]
MLITFYRRKTKRNGIKFCFYLKIFYEKVRN